MVNFSRKLVLFMVGLALLLPPSISAFAEPVTRYPSGPYNFYLDWMSPRVEPMESKVLFVSEYAKRDLPPRKEQVQATAPAPATRYPSGPYNFYLDWMSPRVAPMETRTFPFLTQGTSDEGSHVVSK